jgi:hypothetical protein
MYLSFARQYGSVLEHLHGPFHQRRPEEQVKRLRERAKANHR